MRWTAFLFAVIDVGKENKRKGSHSWNSKSTGSKLHLVLFSSMRLSGHVWLVNNGVCMNFLVSMWYPSKLVILPVF